jgi:hypothetical protein
VVDPAMLAANGALAARRTADGWTLRRGRPDGMVRRWHVAPSTRRD